MGRGTFTTPELAVTTGRVEHVHLAILDTSCCPGCSLTLTHVTLQVRQLREWKKARIEADNFLSADEQRPGASAEMTRELTKMKVEVSQLKARLAQCERCAD